MHNNMRKAQIHNPKLPLESLCSPMFVVTLFFFFFEVALENFLAHFLETWIWGCKVRQETAAHLAVLTQLDLLWLTAGTKPGWTLRVWVPVDSKNKSHSQSQRFRASPLCSLCFGSSVVDALPLCNKLSLNSPFLFLTIWILSWNWSENGFSVVPPVGSGC